MSSYEFSDFRTLLDGGDIYIFFFKDLGTCSHFLMGGICDKTFSWSYGAVHK